MSGKRLTTEQIIPNLRETCWKFKKGLTDLAAVASPGAAAAQNFCNSDRIRATEGWSSGPRPMCFQRMRPDLSTRKTAGWVRKVPEL